MPLSLSGTLRDPYGDPRPGAAIIFRSVDTSGAVLQHASAQALTDQSGGYTIAVELGRYNIEVQAAGSPGRHILARDLLINADTNAADLNELIVAANGYDDLTPQIVLEFQALRDETQGYRDEAAASAAASEANAQATAADAQAAAADREQTGLDAQATAADRQQTTADAQATAADRSHIATQVTHVDDQVAHVDTQRQAVDAAAANASTSATAAAGSEAAAGDSALEAQHWAIHPNDTPVPEGDGSEYSARHWAEIARQRAVNAMVAQGAWDASTGTLPAEPAGASYWLVTGAPSGVTISSVEYRNKDMLLWTPDGSGGGTWSKIDNTDSVSSVAGKTGAVTLVPSDAGADPAGTADAAVAAHAAEADPHAQYVQKVSGKGLSANDYTDAEKTKLGGVETGATQNATDAQLRDRSTHTGTQTLSTISDAGTAAAAAADRLTGSPYCADSGTADSYVLSVNYADAAPTAYHDGDQYRFRAGASNTGASTVNVNGLGAKTLVTVTGVALPAGYVRTDADTTITFDETNDRFVTTSFETFDDAPTVAGAPVAVLDGAGPVQLFNVVEYTIAQSGTTYTPTPGTTHIMIEIAGAGGGGGGADGDSFDTDCGCGGGGGAGGYRKAIVAVEASSYTVAVGAGGAGGGQNTNGSAGGDSTFDSDGNASLSITAFGGEGGASQADFNASIAEGGNGGGSGNLTGTSVIFDFSSEGGSGLYGWAITGQDLAGSGLAVGGPGGSNQLCELEGSRQVTTEDTSTNGIDGNRGGAGGGGGAALGQSNPVNGGVGAPGSVIIYEYKG